VEKNASLTANCEYESVVPATSSETAISAVDGDVEVEKPKIKIGGKKFSLSKSKKLYSKKKKVSFKSKSEYIENGKVEVYVNGKKKKEIKVSDDGKWKYKFKSKKNKTYKVKFKYYNSNGENIDNSKTYKIKIDTKKPKFTDLPLVLNKNAGDKIWWKAEDNDKIDYYKYRFDGKKKKTKKDSFVIPSKTSSGLHWLEVRVYDKAGNKETRRVLIRVK